MDFIFQMRWMEAKIKGYNYIGVPAQNAIQAIIESFIFCQTIKIMNLIVWWL